MQCFVRVRDFEKRIDVVQVDLPKPEDLYLGRMRSRKVVDVPRMMTKMTTKMMKTTMGSWATTMICATR
jgi:hypothetical protein